jgi:hypothetical protein
MNKSTVFLIISCLLIVSCKKDSTIDNAEEPNFDYRAYLLKSQDSLIPTFDFPVNSTTDQIYEVIDNYTQQECFDVFRFNYQIGEFEIQSVAMEYCHEYPPIAHYKTLYLEVNTNESISLDLELMYPKDVKSKSKLFFQNEMDIKSFYVIIYKRNPNSKTEVLRNSLKDIITGYIEFAEEEFERLYKIKMSEASIKQLDEFKSTKRLIFMFVAYPEAPPPPPPPPTNL